MRRTQCHKSPFHVSPKKRGRWPQGKGLSDRMVSGTCRHGSRKAKAREVSAGTVPKKSTRTSANLYINKTQMSHNQNLVLKWSKGNKKAAAPIYGWDCPLLAFIDPGFDCCSNGELLDGMGLNGTHSHHKTGCCCVSCRSFDFCCGSAAPLNRATFKDTISFRLPFGPEKEYLQP